jgi:hypothetical protein
MNIDLLARQMDNILCYTVRGSYVSYERADGVVEYIRKEYNFDVDGIDHIIVHDTIYRNARGSYCGYADATYYGKLLAQNLNDQQKRDEAQSKIDARKQKEIELKEKARLQREAQKREYEGEFKDELLSLKEIIRTHQRDREKCANDISLLKETHQRDIEKYTSEITSLKEIIRSQQINLEKHTSEIVSLKEIIRSQSNIINESNIIQMELVSLLN